MRYPTSLLATAFLKVQRYSAALGECGLSTHTGLVQRVENTDVILAQGQHSRGLYGVAENVASKMLPMFPRWFNHKLAGVFSGSAEVLMLCAVFQV